MRFDHLIKTQPYVTIILFIVNNDEKWTTNSFQKWHIGYQSSGSSSGNGPEWWPRIRRILIRASACCWATDWKQLMRSALVVELQRQSLHGARGRAGLFVRWRRSAIFELASSVFVVQSPVDRRLSDQSNVTLRGRALLLREIVSRPPDFRSSGPAAAGEFSISDRHPRRPAGRVYASPDKWSFDDDVSDDNDRRRRCFGADQRQRRSLTVHLALRAPVWSVIMESCRWTPCDKTSSDKTPRDKTATASLQHDHYTCKFHNKFSSGSEIIPFYLKL